MTKSCTIPFIPSTQKGSEPISTLNPYQRVEAETMADSWGVKTDRLAGKHDVYILFRGGDEQLFDFDWWKMSQK